MHYQPRIWRAINSLFSILNYAYWLDGFLILWGTIKRLTAYLYNYKTMVESRRCEVYTWVILMQRKNYFYLNITNEKLVRFVNFIKMFFWRNDSLLLNSHDNCIIIFNWNVRACRVTWGYQPSKKEFKWMEKYCKMSRPLNFKLFIQLCNLTIQKWWLIFCSFIKFS